MDKDKQIEEIVVVKKKRRRLKWLLFKVFLMILIFFNIIGIILNSPFIQKRISVDIVKYISNKTGYEVFLKEVAIDINNGIQLKDFLIEDLQGDTLMSAKVFNTSLVENLLSMVIFNEYDFSDVVLEDAYLNNRQNKGELRSSLQDFIYKLGTKKGEKKKCTKLDIDNIKLVNVRIINDIFNQVSYHNIKIGEAEISFNRFDLCDKYIDIEKVFISKPIVEIFKRSMILPKTKSNDTLNNPLINIGIVLNINEIELKEGMLAYKYNGQYQDVNRSFKTIDFKDVGISSLNLSMNSFKLDTLSEMDFSIKSFNFKEKNGFQVKSASLEKGMLKNGVIGLDGLSVNTLNSSINGNVSLDYKNKNDFKYFVEKIKIKGDFSNSYVKLNDILYFTPKVKESSILVDNIDRRISFVGKIRGKVNELKSSKFKINIEDKLKFSSGFIIKDITKKRSVFLNLIDMNLVSNSDYIMSIFKNVNFGKKFPKLGNLAYNGDFKGYLKDFQTSGNLKTDLGDALFDVKMIFNKTVDYNGQLMLSDFDIGKLLNKSQLGKLGIRAKLTDGHGLVSRQSNAKVKAKIDSIEINGYKYREIDINALVESNRFNGDLSIKDKNIDLNLNGIIDFEDSIPIYNLNAKLSNVDLYSLNLYKKKLKVEGLVKMDFMGSDADNFSGKVFLDDLRFTNDEKEVMIDSFNISSVAGDNGERYIDIDSDILTFYFDGKYNLKMIPSAIYNIFDRNFSKFVVGLEKPKILNEDFDKYYYDFNLEVNDSKDLIEVLTGKDVNIKYLYLDGFANHENDSIHFNLKMDTCFIDDNNFVGLESEFNLYQGYGDINVSGNSIQYNGANIKNVQFNTDVEQEELYFQMSIDSIGEKVRDIALSGKTVPYVDSFGVEIYGGMLSVIEDQFEFVGQNKVVLGKEYINFTDFVIKDNESKILIEDVNNNKGFKAEIVDFDLSVLNILLKYDKLNFTGKTDGYVVVPDMYSKKYFEGDISIPDLKINDEFYGDFQAKVRIDSIKKNKLSFSAKLGDLNPKLLTKGYYNLKEKIFYGDFKFDKFPLAFLENIINDGISNTEGELSAHMRVFGPFKKVSITGNGWVDNGQTTVDYIGVPYFFDKQKFTVNDKGIDMTGVVITDEFGNEGYATGGITFNRFKDWGVDVTLNSDKIMALKTNQKLNPDYWGTAIGGMKAVFKGEFKKVISMKIDAVTGEGTTLTIPVKLYVDSGEESFINYSKGRIVDEKKRKSRGLKGVDFDMNIKITEAADLKIIMDENAGDNLVGKGNGLIRMVVKQDGEIEMYGDYKFTSGKYLFTLYKVINKEFKITPGSSIVWSGDPFEAVMEITADYVANRISMTNLLTDYNLGQEENYKGDVTLKLLLTGTLIEPKIDFNFDIDNIDNSIKAYVVSKLQELKSSPNALNTQVVGLLVFGSFLPDANLFGNLQNSSFLGSGGINTASEFLSTKLSSYITSILSEYIDESDLISGVDFSLNSKRNSILIDNNKNSVIPQYYYINTSVWLMDNKIKVQFGTDYTFESDFANRDKFFSGGNVTVEMYLTDNKRLKMKMFFRREFDELNNQWENKSGLGVGYGRNFGKIFIEEK